MKGKHNKKQYYVNQEKCNKRASELGNTIRGFLITTDRNKEKEAIRDAYNILNDTIEELCPELNLDNEEGKSGDKSEDALEYELSRLRDNKKRFFFNFDSNVKGILFIKIDEKVKNKISVNDFARHVVEKIKNNGDQLSRCICRFLPVEIAFKAKYENFIKLAPSVLDKYFKKNGTDDFNLEPKKTWKLEFKCRNNNSLKKEDFQQFLLNYVSKEFYKVDVRNPEMVVLIEISNDLLCLSIIDKYYQDKCYNLMELANNNPKVVKIENSKAEERETTLAISSEKIEMKENDEKIIKEDLTEDDNEEEIKLI